MFAKNQNQTSHYQKWLLKMAIIFFVLIVFIASGLWLFEKKYQHKIYPNLFLGDYNLSGKTIEEARQLINQQINKINQTGINIRYQNNKAALKPTDIIDFDINLTINQAINFGRDNNFFTNLKNKLLALLFKKHLYLAVSVDCKKVEKILENKFAFEPAQNAALVIKKTSSTSDYEFSITNERLGKAINYQKAVDLMENNLSNLSNIEIQLSTVTIYPEILSKNCLNIESSAKAFLAQTPITLKYSDSRWTINQDQLADWLMLKSNNPDSINTPVTVGLDENQIKIYLAEQVAPKIDKEPIEGKFKIKNNKVIEFQNSQDGLALDIEANLTKINNEILSNNQIELTVKTQLPAVNSDNINNFGIKEIIGIGTSNFAGSPANRRHNIKTGANSINGLLIKPREEFSLIKALGKIASTTGYLPELVIKENKTTPEYGGGLCQIGTTMFRAVIDSGLPVTLRRNHSYRVQYYEPAGTDATIYDPWPDFRFINDMPAYILVQTKISNNDLTFEFWGTKDNRIIEKTKPIIYNIVKPEPAKIVETLDLKPGEKKCVEHAHNGANAYFDYKVTYPDGQIKEKRFSSRYVPWQEVCLIGVKKLSAPIENASTTPAEIIE